MSESEQIRLTSWSDRAGCGAKAGPSVVEAILNSLRTAGHPDLPSVIVGLREADDAAVCQSSNLGDFVFSVDFISPIVDDPRTFGSIAAANALSDIYAMGGVPTFALALVALPDELLNQAISQILLGAGDKVSEAGAVIVGGHTTLSSDPLFGLAVAGSVSRTQVLTKSSGKIGDRLYITKPIGSGIITTAAKFNEATPSDLEAAISTMAKLNGPASRACLSAGVNCATDVTGFGLIGHALEFCRGGGIGLEIWAGSVPLLPGALKYAYNGAISGGGMRNRKYFEPRISIADTVSEELQILLFDPQTSGGLLALVSEDVAADFEAYCRRSATDAWYIGRATPDGSHLRVRMHP